jgi:hypothetical protein
VLSHPCERRPALLTSRAVRYSRFSVPPDPAGEPVDSSRANQPSPGYQRRRCLRNPATISVRQMVTKYGRSKSSARTRYEAILSHLPQPEHTTLSPDAPGQPLTASASTQRAIHRAREADPNEPSRTGSNSSNRGWS